jgi:hypothetical protein
MYKSYTVVVFDNGDKHWYLNGERHRVDGPAVEFASGSKGWYLNGKLHRVDGPAYEHADGNKHWYLNGKRHRENGPAIEYANGDKKWYLNGEQLTQAEFDKQSEKNACEGKIVEIDGIKYKLKLL